MLYSQNHREKHHKQNLWTIISTAPEARKKVASDSQSVMDEYDRRTSDDCCRCLCRRHHGTGEEETQTSAVGCPTYWKLASGQLSGCHSAVGGFSGHGRRVLFLRCRYARHYHAAQSPGIDGIDADVGGTIPSCGCVAKIYCQANFISRSTHISFVYFFHASSIRILHAHYQASILRKAKYLFRATYLPMPNLRGCYPASHP